MPSWKDRSPRYFVPCVLPDITLPPQRPMGFCLFNNVAILARYLQQHHGLDNILIVDWDVHHGNGTQAIFDDDPSVLYFSVHQYPFYPGTGAATETGRGRGQGFTLNVPLSAGAAMTPTWRSLNSSFSHRP